MGFFILKHIYSMAKKDNSIDISRLKITSGISLIGILVGFGVTIGINVSSFQNMKDQLSNLSQAMRALEVTMDEKFDKRTTQLVEKVDAVQNSVARMEGKMEVYVEKGK